MRTAIRKINNFNTQKLTILVIGSVLISIAFYVYFINLAVVNGAKFEAITENVSDLESSISENELQIVDSKRNIDKLKATESGFIPLSEVVYLRMVSETALNDGANQ